MQKELNGMFWSTGSFDLDLPYIGDTKKDLCNIQEESGWNYLELHEKSWKTTQRLYHRQLQFSKANLLEV